MSPQLPALIIGILSSVVVAVLTSFLTVHFALKRFYAEKAWERKNSAYTAIIESLHHVHNHADTNLSFVLRNADLPESGDKTLTENLQNAMAELRKQLDIGNFVIADDAVKAMDELMSGLEDSTHAVCWQDHLEIKLAAVNKCLACMRKIARRDLSI